MKYDLMEEGSKENVPCLCMIAAWMPWTIRLSPAFALPAPARDP